LTGQVLQHYELDPLFPGAFEKVFLYTWMIDDDYFHWNLVGQDDHGGYASHRMPTLEEDVSVDPTDNESQEEFQEYEQTDYEHDEL
jgi:hypothetical protein